jgi:para-aminobenzoate synthetase component 1
MQHPPLAHLHTNRRDALNTPWGSWSFGPSTASAWVVCQTLEQPARLFDRRGQIRQWADPLEALRWMERFELLGPVGSRWIGYLSYELGRLFENLPSSARDDLNLPLFAFGLFPPATTIVEPAPAPQPARWISGTFTRTAYLQAVERALAYIRAGDVFQVNLSQRFTFAAPASPGDQWRRCLQQGSADYAALLDFGSFSIVSLSPELLLRRAGRDVVTRPIKGTRPRLTGMDQQLRDSGKDRAELNMIVDLERNDLGRICETGSVRVTQPPHVEAHPTVYHGVAEIAGTLRHGVGLPEILRAIFPGGSVTGAPKVRAMEIIDELEPVRRGPYCGAIGYLAGDGTMQLNVAIRTMVLRNGLAHVPVGGGIVADSSPAAEYEETLVKARAMLAALGVDEADFRRRCQGLAGAS